SDPLKTRVDLLYKQANDHLSLVNAYAAYARRLKLENMKQVRIFYRSGEKLHGANEQSGDGGGGRKPEATGERAQGKDKGDAAVNCRGEGVVRQPAEDPEAQGHHICRQ
ncbi:hypothetical protein KI387_043606, partial [Taxus chinensis]